MKAINFIFITALLVDYAFISLQPGAVNKKSNFGEVSLEVSDLPAGDSLKFPTCPLSLLFPFGMVSEALLNHQFLHSPPLTLAKLDIIFIDYNLFSLCN